ncbi:hypothetical protein Celal_0522 [Cellulophaga algicola DSM 14237]|uniref:Transmembrane protein n=1 Tax=Cellulophaga algicola (strain DSM 14237 / IC166 / ACAM 630) TaxID=688270 RepID=E6XBM6_CELAD|nr:MULTISPECIES: hypothetical protein [Cellulophaga]ADV47861.1 hypothetical protein Celal_0522 [Cellulophaga algicola DSM 14237]
MAINPDFLHANFKDNVSKSKLIIGVLLGLILAFLLYEFFYFSREIFRVLSLTSEYDISIFSDDEVSFYNLIFAFLAAIFGQSTCFVYWFDFPLKAFNFRPTRLRTIVNDQRNLNWYFLNWFVKVALVFGVLFYVDGLGWYYDFSFYPEFIYLFILILVVLFLQTWTTILLVFKTRAFKWMLLSGIVLTGVAIGLSKINLISYTTINNLVIEKRINSRFQLKLPYSNMYTKQTKRITLPKVSVAFAKNDAAYMAPVYLLGDDVYTIKSLFLKMNNLNMQRLEFERMQEAGFYFQIDRNMPMSVVENIKKELGILDFQWLNFMVMPPNSTSDEFRYFSNDILSLKIGNQQHSVYLDFEKNEYSNPIEIRFIEGKFMINNTIVAKEDFSSVLLEHINRDKNYYFNFYFNDSLLFGHYIETYSQLLETTNEFRDNLSERMYGIQFSKLNQEGKEVIQNAFPFRYNEVVYE